MRDPVNPVAGMGPQLVPVSVTVQIEVFESQPGGPTGDTPRGELAPVRGTFTDDAARPFQKTLDLDIAEQPDWFSPGMWVRPTIGIRRIEPVLYRFPAMMVTDITKDEGRFGGAKVLAAEPSIVVNGRPYESDTTLPAIASTLRELVAQSCALALTRPTDVSQVPALPIPAGMVAEFGSGRWDVCIRVADDLGVALRFTDAGDVEGRIRADPLPSPVAEIQQAILPGGTMQSTRVPSAAQVLVTRGNGIPGLVGHASTEDITGVPLPPWYRPYVVSDRHEGGPATTQVEADQLARDLLRVRLTDLETFDALGIAPAPWIEAGLDVVTFSGKPYHVRAMTMDIPSLLTTVTLRRADL